MKPTSVKCVDGKRHTWRYTGFGSEGAGPIFEHKWCERCGSRTETVNGNRCKDDDGSLYIEIPSLAS